MPRSLVPASPRCVFALKPLSDVSRLSRFSPLRLLYSFAANGIRVVVALSGMSNRPVLTVHVLLT